MRNVHAGLLIVAALFLTASAGAQAPVTAADLTRLDTSVTEIERQVTTLRRTDATLAADIERSLADLRDEVAYLRVTLRREGNVTRAEYTALRDQLENLRIRAQGQKVYGRADQRRPGGHGLYRACRHRVRHPAADASPFGQSQGRGSVRGHDDARLRDREYRRGSGRLDRSRVRELREGGRQDRTQGQPDAVVRRTPDRQSIAPPAGVGDPGARSKGRGGCHAHRRRRRCRRRSSAACSAAERARFSACSSAAAARSRRPKGQTWICPSGPCFESGWIRRSRFRSPELSGTRL